MNRIGSFNSPIDYNVIIHDLVMMTATAAVRPSQGAFMRSCSTGRSTAGHPAPKPDIAPKPPPPSAATWRCWRRTAARRPGAGPPPSPWPPAAAMPKPACCCAASRRPGTRPRGRSSPPIGATCSARWTAVGIPHRPLALPAQRRSLIRFARDGLAPGWYLVRVTDHFLLLRSHGFGLATLHDNRHTGVLVSARTHGRRHVTHAARLLGGPLAACERR